MSNSMARMALLEIGLALNPNLDFSWT